MGNWSSQTISGFVVLFVAAAMLVIGGCDEADDNENAQPLQIQQQNDCDNDDKLDDHGRIVEQQDDEREEAHSAAREREAEIQLSNLQLTIETYAIDNDGQLPDDLENLTRGPHPYIEEVPDDPWGNDYLYEVHSDTEYDLYSAGADEEPGTDRDIYPE